MKIRFSCENVAVKRENKKLQTLDNGKINDAFELESNNNIVKTGTNHANLQLSNVDKPVEDIPLNKEDGYRMEHSQPLKAVLLSSLFWTNLLWFVSTHLRVIFFLGNFNSWITFLTNGNTQNVSMYTSVFSFMSFTSIIVSLLAGAIIDRRTMAPVGSLAFKLEKFRHFIPMFYLNIGLGVLLSACAAIPVLELQYFTFVVFVFHRTFNYGPATAFIAQAFPIEHFGRLYGINNVIGAIVSLLQYPLFIWIKGPLKNDSMWVNIILLCFAAVSVIHPINVWLYCRMNASRIHINSEQNKVKDMHREDNHIQPFCPLNWNPSHIIASLHIHVQIIDTLTYAAYSMAHLFSICKI
ncbi:unnamed protein product [Owenia fusiformis]|uniref:Uncharacterized protein n=1 Tax=Owenia fusiformis TaxID=6347 RepID=A0A8S4Q3A8_OWEFU|nr:unnamed protein product [Owenia fusiformis]